MTLPQITTFLGWCTAIKVAVLMLAAIAATTMNRRISDIHARMFGIDLADVRRAYFSYLGTCKIAILIICLVPYIVLRTLL